MSSIFTNEHDFNLIILLLLLNFQVCMLEPASSDYSPFNFVSILYLNIYNSILQLFPLLEK